MNIHFIHVNISILFFKIFFMGKEKGRVLTISILISQFKNNRKQLCTIHIRLRKLKSYTKKLFDGLWF